MTEHSAYLRDLTTGSEWDKPSNGTCEKLIAAAAHIDAQDAKIKALVEALEAITYETDHGCIFASYQDDVDLTEFVSPALTAAKETTA